ncbi:hypothetical protein [Xenorhabdus hominickii]|nr:hypothetical protein [Xenorhabdus hominickii]
MEGSGRSSQFGKRDINSAIKELYNNMLPTMKNFFVLDEFVKEFNKSGQMSTYVKNIGKLATDFLGSEYRNNDNKDIVENQYDYFSGRKADWQRNIQEGLFFLGNMETALTIGKPTRGSTNITSSAIRFATQGKHNINPAGVLQDNSRMEGS